jgi:hypothetical protein
MFLHQDHFLCVGQNSLKKSIQFFHRFPTIPFKLFEKPEMELFAESNFRSLKVDQSSLRKKCPKNHEDNRGQ